MSGHTAGSGGAEPAAFRPPREPTRLARYSRRSKLTIIGFGLCGIMAFFYLLGEIPVSQIVPPAEHHTPKILSADQEEKEPAAPAPAATNAADQNAMAGMSESGELLNQQDDHKIVMAPAPDPHLTETTPLGDLPRIGEDGRKPWQIYARPFNTADSRPRLAIIVADLGLARGITDAAVSRLPANVTLAFDVQSPAIGAWCARARQDGHEILLSVPMEPFDFPRSDPGAHTLLTTSPNNINLEKLNWALRQGIGYVGITTMTGSRFTSDGEKLKTVMETLKQRGLMVLDTHIAPHGTVTDLAHEQHVPVATVNERIDENLSPDAIDAALQQLEQEARLTGRAVGIVAPLPVVIDHVQSWLHSLPQDGIALAPVSAMVQ